MSVKRMTAAVTIAALAWASAGCGGGSVSDEATEEGAIAAVRRSQLGLLRGDADAVIGFLNQECRDSVDEDEIRLALGFIEAFIGDEVDLDKIEVDATIESFDGDTAEVAVTYQLPDGADADEFGFAESSIDILFENGKWVADGCDFGDGGAQAEADDLAEQLEALGYAGTRDDPVPTGVGAPVGDGFTVSIDGVDPDAAAAIEAGGGYVSEPDPGHRHVIVEATIGYVGEDEPMSIGSISFTGIGGSSASGTDFYGCNGMERELSTFSTRLLSGGVVSGYLCAEVPIDDIDGMLVDVGPSFGDLSVVFDPTASAATPSPVTGTPGPDPDGALAAGRENPIALGTATQLGDDWTLTVNGIRTDGTAVLAAASEYNDPPATGIEYVLVDVTVAYSGDEPSYVSSVQMEAVGDGNVAIAGGSCSSSWDEALDMFTELYADGSVSGEVCFPVAASDVSSLQLLASSGWGEESEVFALG